jgi:hypothetical protein
MALVVGKSGGQPKATEVAYAEIHVRPRVGQGGGWDGHRNQQGNRGGLARRIDWGLMKSDEDD